MQASAITRLLRIAESVRGGHSQRLFEQRPAHGRDADGAAGSDAACLIWETASSPAEIGPEQ